MRFYQIRSRGCGETYTNIHRFAVITLYNKMPSFKDPKEGKGENASNQHFLCFQECFLPYQNRNHNLKYINFFCLQLLSTRFSPKLLVKWMVSRSTIKNTCQTLYIQGKILMRVQMFASVFLPELPVKQSQIKKDDVTFNTLHRLILTCLNQAMSFIYIPVSLATH